MKDRSTLSADTKDALAREAPQQLHCANALIAALAFYGNRTGTQFTTQRPAVARLFWALLDERKSHPIRQRQSRRLDKRPMYEIGLPDRLREPPPKPHRRCDRIAEIRGAFLAAGSLSAANQGYHLEFVLASREAMERLRSVLHSVVREPKTALRQQRWIVYYKDFEAIAALLSTLGAFAAVLRLEDVRALKETKNRIHRLVNSEAANLERATNAAATQRRAIELIADAYGLRKLPRSLREIAELRIQHPDETLAELGRRCNPPATKSAVNSRFISLFSIAARLRGEQGRHSLRAHGTR
ncbi:MAG: DNA-binding protein WhiA [Candidatus Eremiobacteraeota bacterium]|nr:DNA-binding protein WhiA [Candidatus Eremiobacteraeota bacterium]